MMISKIFRKKFTYVDIICFAVFVLVICFFIRRSIVPLVTAENADVSAEEVLAKLLSEEGTLLSMNWYYSTEIRFFYLQIIMAPLFTLTSDWETVRSVTTLVFGLFFLMSYIFMVKPLNLDLKWVFLSSALLMSPISRAIQDALFTGLYYSPNVILVFLSMGILLRLINSKINREYSEKYIILLWMLAVLVNISAGIAGMRCFLIFNVPVFLSSVILYIIIKFSKIKTNYDNIIVQAKNGILYSFIFCIIAGIGYLISSKYLENIYHFSASADTGIVNIFDCNMADRIWQVFKGLFINIGYKDNILTQIFSIIILAVSIYIIVRVIIEVRKNGIYAERIYVIFFIISFLINHLAFILLNTSFLNGNFVSRYQIFSLIYIIPIYALYMKHEDRVSIKSICIISLAFGIVFCGIRLNTVKIGNKDNNLRTGYIEYLEDNNIDFGYSTYWNANITIEMSNGEIEVAPLTSMSDLKPFRWLTRTYYFEKEYNNGKTFVVMTLDEEMECMNNNSIGFFALNASREYFDDMYVVYVFENSDILERKILE